MTATELLKDCARRDIRLQADGPDLIVNAPRRVLTDSVLADLKARKLELLALLAPPPPPPPPLSPEVRWRADAMQLQRGEGALPVLVARLGLAVTDACCFSCGDELAAPTVLGRLGRCEDCRQAAEWVCRAGSR